MEIINRLQAYLGLSVFFWHDDMEIEREIESIQRVPESKVWWGHIGYGVNEQFFVCGDLNDKGEAVMTGLRIAVLKIQASDITVELTYISFLTDKERDYFIKAGHDESDFGQLARAIQDVKLTYQNEKETEVPITREEAERILGYEEFLSGISRAAFHESAWRTPEIAPMVKEFISALVIGGDNSYKDIPVV